MTHMTNTHCFHRSLGVMSQRASLKYRRDSAHFTLSTIPRDVMVVKGVPAAKPTFHSGLPAWDDASQRERHKRNQVLLYIPFLRCCPCSRGSSQWCDPCSAEPSVLLFAPRIHIRST